MFWMVQHKQNFLQVRIEYSYGQLCVCIYKGVHLKSKLQHSGTWLATARWLHHLCCHSAAFFRHLHLAALSFLQGKIWHAIQKCYLIFIYFFFKLRHLGSVCTVYIMEPWINACARGGWYGSTCLLSVLGIFSHGCTAIWLEKITQ